MKHLQLTPEDLEALKSFTRSGNKNVREINRAYILLWLHKGKKMAEIEDFLEVERTAIWRTKKNYLEKGLDHAIKDNPRSGQPKKYKQKQEAEIIALACSDPPEGRQRWTLELLTRQAKKQKGLETINRESIRLMLKKTNVNLG
jgi:putative transposase